MARNDSDRPFSQIRGIPLAERQNRGFDPRDSNRGLSEDQRTRFAPRDSEGEDAYKEWRDQREQDRMDYEDYKNSSDYDR